MFSPKTDSACRLLPKLEAIPLDNTQRRGLVHELHVRRAVLAPTCQNIQAAIHRLLQSWASTVTLTSPSYSGYYGGRVNRTQPTMDALEFCLSVNTPDTCAVILTRLLHPPKLDGKYVQEYLAPLVPELRAFLVKHKQPLTSPVFAPVFRSIIQLWIQKVMGAPPPDTPSVYMQQLQTWGCSCSICKPVQQFLISSPHGAQSWPRIGAPNRKHLEAYLLRHARAVATWDTIRSVPQGITVRPHFCVSIDSQRAHTPSRSQNQRRYRILAVMPTSRRKA